MISALVFDPLLPWVFVGLLGLAALLSLGFGIWRGLPGWFFRSIALMALGLALLNPLWKQEDRLYQQDIAIVIIDESSSQTLGERSEQTRQALGEVQDALAAFDGSLQVEIITVGDAGRDGTLLLSALSEAAGAYSPNRIAAAILITDGQINDADALSDFPAPVHVFTTGVPSDWDRRILVKTAPAYGIVGEPVEVVVRIEDLGAAPQSTGVALVIASVDGGPEQQFTLPLNEDIPLSLAVERGGINLLEIRTPPVEGELTDQNNRAILSLNGVRDRLRVLLISGEPYAGERTWRNLLKADSSVDLVHFTILRPPNKQDGVPYEELSLIAFPTQELFMDKIDDFDLIIFDRFRRQGVLPEAYLENVARYVRDGGAILVASGPAFATVESLYRTPLRAILPAAPTGRVIEQGFTPLISELGQRHPVTEGLQTGLPDILPDWGRWFRIIEVVPTSGYTLMEGPNNLPLLQLDRVGRGRLALLASDQAWLWSRGFEGGGPQRELLRRLAHWLMQEPELEENVLQATALGMSVVVDRQMLDGEVGMLEVISPSGQVQMLEFEQLGPGRWRSAFEADESGVYRLSEDTVTTVVATGPATPIEFENPIATTELLAPLVGVTDGGSFLLSDGVPNFRQVNAGRTSAGRNWAGLVRRDAFQVQDLRLTPLAKGWIYLLIAAFFSLMAWRYEGR